VRLTASALDFSRDKERKEIETCNEIGKNITISGGRK